MDVRQQIDKIPGLERKLCGLRKDLNDLTFVSDITDLQMNSSFILTLTYTDENETVKTKDVDLSNLIVPTEFKPDIVVNNYTDLQAVTGQTLFEFAEVQNSQGTAWLPGSLGGSYHGAGLYYWNGTEWINDNDSIYNAFQQFTMALTNKSDVGHTHTADEINDDTTLHKFATQVQLDQILDNQNDIVNLDVDVQNLENDKAEKNININANKSLSGGGNLTTDINLELNGDENTPGNDKYYGTSPAGTKGYNDLPTNLITGSGRFYCHTDNRWVTESDDNYGNNHYQFEESGGTGAAPIVEWQHLGAIIPKGKKLKTLRFVCRANNTQVTNIQLYIICRRPNPITRWQSGMDADGEDTVDVLFNGNFADTSFSGNMGDLRMKVIDLNNFVVPEDSMVSIYLRPQGSLSSTRYLFSNWAWEYL